MADSPEYQSLIEAINNFQKNAFKVAKLDRATRVDIAKRLLKVLNQMDVVDGNDQNFLFKEAEQMNIHILRPGYYSALPSTKDLSDKIWSELSELVGIKINDDVQLKLLESFASEFRKEYEQFPDNPSTDHQGFFLSNTNFGPVDAEILYCMIRSFKPKRIIEIGSGYSTLLSAKAILKNRSEDSNYFCDLVSIEPYPHEFLTKGFEGLTTLIKKKVQDVPLSFFQQLDENDILFIDSSHVLKIGSDVAYEYLEIIPRLKNGVLVHAHDIFLPYDYPQSWVLENKRFWNEQYLLQAFLMFNDTFKILWASTYMNLKYPHKLEIAFDSYRRTRRAGGSFWVQKTK